MNSSFIHSNYFTLKPSPKPTTKIQIAQHRASVQPIANSSIPTKLDSEKPTNRTFRTAIQEKNYEFALKMLHKGVPSEYFEIKLIDPNKRNFAKAWLEQIKDPTERLFQALRFKEYEFIEEAYESLLSAPSKEEEDKSPILTKLWIQNPQLVAKRYVFKEAWRVACAENVKLVKVLVKLGYPPDYIDINGQTGLHLACINLKGDIVDYLTSLNRIDPNQKDGQGKTALQSALEHRKKNNIPQNLNRIIISLLHAGGEIEEIEEAQWIWEYLSKDKPIRELLIKKHPYLICLSLCASGDSYQLKELMTSNQLSLTSEQLSKVWILACGYRDERLVKFLFESKIISLEMTKKGNGLHVAANAFAKKTMEYLLDVLSFDVNSLNDLGLSPLQVLCQSKAFVSNETKIDMALDLLRKQSKVSPAEAFNVFKWCCVQDDGIRAQLLMEIKDIPIQENEGQNSFLHAAAQMSAHKILNYLLKVRVWNVNLRNEKSATPLFLVCELDSLNREIFIKMIQSLLEAKADPNIPNKEGKFPLINFFLKIWNQHMSKVNISTYRSLNTAWSKSSQSSNEKKCITDWSSGFHPFAKMIIDLFATHGAELGPLISLLETMCWEEQVNEAPPAIGPYSVEYKSNVSSNMVQKTTYYFNPGTPVYRMVTRKHALKDIAEVTYEYLKSLQKR